MDRASAQKIVRKYLIESDKKEFDILVENLKDPSLITQEEMIEGADKVTEIFDRNSIQIIAQPKGGIIEMNVLHKGREVT
jgi:hypothetical protein